MRDIPLKYAACTGDTAANNAAPAIQGAAGTVRTTTRLNIRKARPSTMADVFEIVERGAVLKHAGWTEDSDAVNGNKRWYVDERGNFFWSGAVLVD